MPLVLSVLTLGCHASTPDPSPSPPPSAQNGSRRQPSAETASTPASPLSQTASTRPHSDSDIPSSPNAGPRHQASSPSNHPTIPPGLNASAVTPLVGKARQHALMTLPQILKSIAPVAWEVPDPLAVEAQTRQRQFAEPPMAAMHAYIRGREAWANHRWFEAKRQLEQALTLTPNHPHLLSLLARLWAISGNPARSSQYLRKIMKVQPHNLDVAMQLGQYTLDRGDYDQAIGIFNYIHEHYQFVPDLDPAMDPLALYYLSIALQRRQYVAASIQMQKAYFSWGQIDHRTSTISRQLRILRRQHGLLYMEMGDAYCLLGQWEHALQAYRHAEQFKVPDEIKLVRRILYVCLKRGRSDEARTALTRLLKRESEDVRTLELIRFWSQHTPDQTRFLNQLQQTYQRGSSNKQIAILIAQLLPWQQGITFIQKHLKTHPKDFKAFQWAIRHWHLTPAPSPANLETETLQAATHLTLQMMTHDLQNADRYSNLLIQEVVNPSRILDLLGRKTFLLPSTQAASAMFLQAQCLARQGDTQKSRKLLEQLLKQHPDWLPARLRLTIFYLARHENQQALQMLEPLASSRDSRVVALRVQILSALGKPDEALTLLDQSIAEHPRGIRLILNKARLQLKLHRPTDAEQTLLNALTANPKAEDLYDMLFQLYDQQAIPDAANQYQRLMWRILRNIPRSRIARLRLAEAHLAAREMSKAKTLLTDLLKENDKDYRALSLLLEMYRNMQQIKQADQLIANRLSQNPDDRILMALAQVHYDKTNQKKKAFEITVRLIQMTEDKMLQAVQLGTLYLAHQQENKAVQILEAAWPKAVNKPDLVITITEILGRAYVRLKQPDHVDRIYTRAIKAAPKQEADLRYQWAQMLQVQGLAQQSEQMMRLNLKRFADHAPTNNGLGYTWADHGKNLSQALGMIQKALKKEPHNTSYLDSLGWVHYKLGHFDLAVRYLTQARNSQGGDYPVVLDHLGDALYRNGKKQQARRVWIQALSLFKQMKNISEVDPDMQHLDTRLKRKLQAVREKTMPPLAPISETDQNPPSPPSDSTPVPAPALAPAPAPAPAPAMH